MGEKARAAAPSLVRGPWRQELARRRVASCRACCDADVTPGTWPGAIHWSPRSGFCHSGCGDPRL